MTLNFEECLFAKVDFEAYEKEKRTHSLQGKIAAEEGHRNTQRPWQALYTLMGRAVIRSDTKLAMAHIGISLHAPKSKESYSVQFVCNSCKRSTDVLFPVCEDRFLRDEADMTMCKVFAPYFEVMNICLPAPPPPPPMPALGYVQTLFAPPLPAPRSGSRSSNLLLPNVANINADKSNTEEMRQRRWGADTDTTASVTSKCDKRDGDAVSSDTIIDCVPYYCPPAPLPVKWECYWHHGRSQQPVDAETTDRRGGPKWKWTGDGPNDWEWSPSWSWTDGQWQFR